MPTLRGGLIGAHISRTRLPGALQIMCDLHGWALEWQLLDTADNPSFDFEATVDMVRSDGWTGVTVTHPWKLHARGYAGKGMKGDIAHLGASNTLIFDAKVVGYNTDFTGFMSAFRACDLNPGNVVMVGAGGVAEALAPALVALGATTLRIHDIDMDKATLLANACGARAIEAGDLPQAIRDADGLVNATPFGMVEYPGSAFDAATLGPQNWAFDAVYTPTNTAFLQAARAAGLTCLTGFDLFRHMAIGSFAAYTGVDVDTYDLLPRLAELEPA